MTRENPQPLLITGAAGFLGWQLFEDASRRGTAVGTFHKAAPEPRNSAFARCDLTDFHDAKELMGKARPRAVIHAAAIADAKVCQDDPSLSYRVNVEASTNLAGLAADMGIPFVFISTDLVFDGTSPPYNETADPNPLSRYGEHKATAEEKIRAAYSKASIFRLPLMVGPSTPGSRNFTQQCLRDMRAGKSLQLFRDEFRSPLSTPIAARAVLDHCESNIPILHLGGLEALSRFNMGAIMADVLEIPEARLVAISRTEVPMASSRPADVSFDNSKAKELGFLPPSFADDLRALRGQL